MDAVVSRLDRMSKDSLGSNREAEVGRGAHNRRMRRIDNGEQRVGNYNYFTALYSMDAVIDPWGPAEGTIPC